MLRPEFSSALILFAGLTLGSLAEAKTLPVRGSVQFWQKDCASEGGPICVPEPLTERFQVEAEIPDPATGGLSFVRRTVDAPGAGLAVDITFYRRSPLPGGPAGVEPFRAAQAILRLKGEPFAECSLYNRDQGEFYFPVGACSAFLDGRQLGVSFFKTR